MIDIMVVHNKMTFHPRPTTKTVCVCGCLHVHACVHDMRVCMSACATTHTRKALNFEL